MELWVSSTLPKWTDSSCSDTQTRNPVSLDAYLAISSHTRPHIFITRYHWLPQSLISPHPFMNLQLQSCWITSNFPSHRFQVFRLLKAILLSVSCGFCIYLVQIISAHSSPSTAEMVFWNLHLHHPGWVSCFFFLVPWMTLMLLSCFFHASFRSNDQAILVIANVPWVSWEQSWCLSIHTTWGWHSDWCIAVLNISSDKEWYSSPGKNHFIRTSESLKRIISGIAGGDTGWKKWAFTNRSTESTLEVNELKTIM